jgi:DNA (cytosine-5)-methyltransferase 1
MNELALFAGAGGGILGGKLLGWKCVCAVEYDPSARQMLAARQNDGCLEPFPIWDDVRTFDGKPWRGLVDVVSGGFPCQDISAAGKGAGLDGERSGLWSEMSRIIGEVRPRFAFVENSPVLTSRGLGVVLGDLAAMGYDAQWGVLGAIDAGAPHKRERIWIVAHSMRTGLEGLRTESTQFIHPEKWQNSDGQIALCSGNVADSDSISGRTRTGRQNRPQAGNSGWWSAEPDVGRVAHGVASRVDRLRAIGNGQVPAVAALAWRILTQTKHTTPTP